MSSKVFISGLAITAFKASIISPRLCGGILVAIPTAIPEDPLMSKLGTFVGRTAGSFKELS